MRLGEIAQIQNGNTKPINSVTFPSLLSTGHQSTEYVVFMDPVSSLKAFVNLKLAFGYITIF